MWLQVLSLVGCWECLFDYSSCETDIDLFTALLLPAGLVINPDVHHFYIHAYRNPLAWSVLGMESSHFSYSTQPTQRPN